MHGHRVLLYPILREPWQEVNSIDALMEDFAEATAISLKYTLEHLLECEILEQLQTQWGQHNPDRWTIGMATGRARFRRGWG